MSEENHLGLMLRELLNKRSLSMRKLSELTEIDTATISRIINGKRKANLQHLEKFADCLEVPITELFEAAGYPIEKRQEKSQSEIQTSVKVIENFLESSNLYDKKFSIASVEQKLTSYGQYSETEEGKDTILNSFDEKLQKVGSIGPFICHLKDLFKKFRLRKGTPYELAIIGSALLYFIIPVDVIPDYIFPIGYLDDAIAVQIVLNLLSD
ncbi:DUF1232 domain-containing protein [Lederbergia citrea]|uniref:Helix-turn-helix domain-containing protein n=1 Tax=Lederbergia citrea TaxID=2833581 RepID=A0A942Z5E1_9BACI|nr:DUF1232 domain-containing protein [Lederbergia citrea]MBS4179234.1 helix-turn-helix domain-containing protein [Lederbergia citrea]MBS4205897.1 helix-turn-helix domain-containing protein [Lederbergia citrea]MBS4224654.1 helix-turn-helix domain-containing protein [Lederbergia citrea]